MAETKYEEFIRSRITDLRLRKNVSEHKMSLDLDKSGSYIRGISSGAALPSTKELFNIIEYFEMTPSEFFAPLDNTDTPSDGSAGKWTYRRSGFAAWYPFLRSALSG